jgi:agmatine deiminase
MPAEWQPQAATWVSWPHNEETWPENLAEAQAEFVALVKAISEVQPVKVLAAEKAFTQASEKLKPIANVEIVQIPTNDAWARDYAPTFVLNESKPAPLLDAKRHDSENSQPLVALDWEYNAWGGKYPPFDQDQLVATRIAHYLGIPVVSPSLCFEGGGIEVNDSGIMLCTKSCALHPNRNPGMSRDEIEAIFRHHLGVNHIIWLSGDAVEGDDTDGHIDQLARFTDDRTVVYAWSDDKHDPQRTGLSENLNDLRSGLEAIGCGGHRLIPLPIPSPMELHGRKIPASYCNFLICNGLVIVPQFNQPVFDAQAMRILEPLFPQHRVKGLDSLNLTVGLGSFHCLSQQQPATGKVEFQDESASHSFRATDWVGLPGSRVHA